MENKATSCSSYVFYFFILSIGLGIEAHSFWVGLCAFFALVFVAQVWDLGTDLNYSGFYVSSVLGLGLLTLTMYLDKYTPRFSWAAAVLVVAALVFLGTGLFLITRGNKFTGWLSLLVSIGVGAYTFGLAQRWIHPTGAAAQQPWLQNLTTGISLWGSLAAALGIILIIAAYKQADDLEESRYMTLVVLGLAALGTGSWLARLQPVWEWVAFWLVGAVLIFLGARILRQYIDFYPHGKIGQGIAVACALFGLAGPLLLNGGISLSDLKLDTLQWGAIWPFFWNLVKSGWGAVYLALLLVFAQMWVPRWGALLTVIGLSGFAAWQGLENPLITALQPVLTVNPVQAFTHLLSNPQAQPGSSVWVFVILAVVISILTLPLNRATLWKSRGFQEVLQKFGPVGNDTMQRILAEEGIGCGWYLSWILLGTIGLAVPVSLWMALHGLSGSVTLSFPLLGIPDLIRPDWKPVWEWHYFILPLAYSLFMYLSALLSRRYGLNNAAINFWSSLFIGVVIGLFAPAGVMIYLCTQTVTQLLITPAMFMGYKPAKVNQGRIFPPAAPQPVAQPAQPAYPAQPAAQPVRPAAPVQPTRPEPAPALETSKNPFMVFKEILSNRIVDLLVTDQNDVFTVDDSGAICLNAENNVKRISNISRANLVGIASGSDNRLVIVRSDGTVELVDRTPTSGAAPAAFHTHKPIACFAVNPYGTKLVYAAPGEACVMELNLLNSKESLLCEHLSEVKALAFSKDSQHLAVGLDDGGVDVISISSRSLASSLVSGDGASGTVTHLAAGPTAQWVVVYQNRVIAHWDQFDSSAPENLVRSDQWVTCLSVDSQSGQVACGCRGGVVITYPLDLGAYNFRQPVFTSDVTRLAFLKGGETLVGVSQNDPLKRVRI